MIIVNFDRDSNRNCSISSLLWLGIESIKIKRCKKENERRIQKRVPKKEMEEQKSYGFTKILCCVCGSKLKKRYLKSFDGSIINNNIIITPIGSS